MRTLVAITYISGGAQGNELALAIAGWRKHFKDDFEILVVGDMPPVQSDVWMYVERLKPKEGEYLPSIDICNKLLHVCQYCKEHSYDGFVWASDDFFAVNDFTLEDVKTPKYQDDEMPRKWDKTSNRWWLEQVKTRKLCEENGYGIVNWVTHLPMYFDAERLYWLIRDFDMTNHGCIVENVYYNAYPQDGKDGKPEKLYLKDRWKFGVYYSPLDREGFQNALAHKIWVCCSEHGWSKELENELYKHYNQWHSTK